MKKSFLVRAVDHSTPSWQSITSFLVAALLLPISACAPLKAPQSQVVQDRNLATVDELLSASERRDLGGLMAFFSEDARLSIPFLPSGARDFHGATEIELVYRQLFQRFSTIHYSDRQYTVSRDGGTVFVEVQGDFERAQGAGDYDNFFVFRVDFTNDGRVARLTQYQNSFYTAQIFRSDESTED